MAGMSPYAAAPPPPPIGGNRKSKLIVGGQTSNLGYTAGADLQNARTAYQTNQQMGVPQNALQRGFIQGQAQGAPDFTQSQTNQMQAGQGLTPAQAQGRQLQQNTLGQVRPTNAPQGLGYGRSNALGVVRQHTINGNEMTDGSMSYNATPPPPPPPVAPATTTPTTDSNGNTTYPGAGIVNTHSNAQTPVNTYEYNKGIRGTGNWKVGDTLNYMDQNGTVKSGVIVSGQYHSVKTSADESTPSQKVYVPYIKTADGKLVVHPAWWDIANSNNVWHAPPAGMVPAPTPQVGSIPAGTAPPIGISSAVAAPKPTAAGSQAVRQKYSGQLNKGVRVYGSDGMQRIVQYMGKSPSGAMVPWVNRPGSGYMIHPDWQGI